MHSKLVYMSLIQITSFLFAKYQFTYINIDLLTCRMIGIMDILSAYWGHAFLRVSNFSCLQFIEVVSFCVYYTIPFGSTLFWHFWTSLFNFLYYFVWLSITDEGSVSEMRIWSILFIKSDLKWCTHLGISLYSNSTVIQLLCFNTPSLLALLSFWHFWASLFNFLYYFVLNVSITD